MAKLCCGDRSEEKSRDGDKEIDRGTYRYSPLNFKPPPLPTAEEEQLERLGGELAFSNDTYDAAYVCILRYFSRPASRKYATLSLIVTLTLHLGCIFLQTAALFLLIAFAIEQKQDPYESENLAIGEQKLRHAASGNFTLDPTLSFVKLCLEDHSAPYTAAGFTWLWTIKLLPTFTHTIFFFFLTCALDTKYEGSPIVKLEKSGKDAIVSATHSAKFITTLIVTIPRIFVTVYMWWAGTKFLAFADTLALLITKCVSLAFILQFPEFVFKAFLHKVIAESVSKATLRYDETRTLGNLCTKYEHHAEMKLTHYDSRTDLSGAGMYEHYSHWKVWGHPLLLLVSSALLACIVRYERFEDVITFREACHYYKENVLAIRCVGMECGSFYFGYHFFS